MTLKHHRIICNSGFDVVRGRAYTEEHAAVRGGEAFAKLIKLQPFLVASISQRSVKAAAVERADEGEVSEE